MGNGSLVDRHLDEILLGSLHAFRDGGSNLVGLAQSPADHTVTVADNDDSGEAEGTSTLRHLGDAVDGYQAILQFQIVCSFDFIDFCHDLL